MNMNAQSNFASMRADLKNELQHMYSKVGAIEDRVGIQEINIDNVMTTISKLDAAYQNRFQEYETCILDIKEVLAENMPSNFDHVSGNAKKIAILEDQLSKMKMSGKDQHSKTMVVGGIGEDIDADEAEKWVRDQIQKYSKSTALEVFAKGEYHRMLFCKFDSEGSRDACVANLRRTSPQRHQNQTQFSEDQPVDVRSCFSILFGARRLLLNWGESKDKIWVDKNDFILYYGLNTVLICEIQNSEIKVHINPEWAQYFDGTLDDLIHTANTALARSSESKVTKKGKSKGMANSKGKGKEKS